MFTEGYLSDVPQGKSERLAWLKTMWGQATNTTSFFPALQQTFSPEVLNTMRYVEAFERCEYGGRLTHENVKTLFPFGVVNF